MGILKAGNGNLRPCLHLAKLEEKRVVCSDDFQGEGGLLGMPTRQGLARVIIEGVR